VSVICGQSAADRTPSPRARGVTFSSRTMATLHNSEMTITIDSVSYDSARWQPSGGTERRRPMPQRSDGDGQGAPRDLSRLERRDRRGHCIPSSPGPRSRGRRSGTPTIGSCWPATPAVTSETIAADLVDAAERGVDISVLLERAHRWHAGGDRRASYACASGADGNIDGESGRTVSLSCRTLPLTTMRCHQRYPALASGRQSVAGVSD